MISIYVNFHETVLLLKTGTGSESILDIEYFLTPSAIPMVEPNTINIIINLYQ